MNDGRRPLLLLLLALLPPLWLGLALAPRCLANKNADIPQFDPPTQNYAVIDLSCNQPDCAAVDLVALGDNNQAAFAYPATDANGNASYGVVHWHQGACDPAHYLPMGSLTLDGTNYLECYKPDFLTSDGTLYGLVHYLGSNAHPFGDTKASYSFSNNLPNVLQCPSPFMSDPDHLGAITLLHDVNDTASCGMTSALINPGGPDDGNPVDSRRYGALGFISGGSVNTFFHGYDTCERFHILSDNWNHYHPWLTTNIQSTVTAKIFPLDCLPCKANAQGWAIGQRKGTPLFIWNGQTEVDVAGGVPVDLNDQNQVVVEDYTPFGGIYTSGYLWEDGASTSFADQLPFWMAWQYFGIQPFSIGNQVAPATDTTIHILTDVQGIDVGKYGKTLFTRDHASKWTFANIALPDGTTIEDWTSINSSGVIAAIGNGGHALLLVPVELGNISPPVSEPAPNSVGAYEPISAATANTQAETIISQNGNAYIFAHTSASKPSPDMPHLVAKLAQGSDVGMVKWRLHVTYKRPNGQQSTDDEVFVPFSADHKHPEWVVGIG